MAWLRRNHFGTKIVAGALLAGLAIVTGSAAAGEGGVDVTDIGTVAPVASADPPGVKLVDEVALPVGFKPEGIAIGDKPIAFFGSLANGSIFRADLVTGAGAVIGEAPGTPAVGLKLDEKGRLFVAGGKSGTARVVDSATGRVLANYDLTDEAVTFVNDVVVTSVGAFFTETKSLVIYHLPIGESGNLPTADAVKQIKISGDMKLIEGPNSNGIVVAPDRKSLILVQTGTGFLFSFDPATGVTKRITVTEKGGDGLVPGGDGLLVIGQTLFVVQNRQNTLTAIKLDATGAKGEVTSRLKDKRFDVPTTVAAFGKTLYLPNARGFDAEINDQTVFTAVGVPVP